MVENNSKDNQFEDNIENNFHITNNTTKTREINPLLPPFSAKGDSHTDDTEPIQRAIDSLKDGGRIIITRRFRITTINLKSNISIIGSGQENSGFISKSETVLNIPEGTLRWSLFNFGIWGNNNNIGIQLLGSSVGIADFSIREIFIKNCKVGYYSTYAWSFLIERVRFQDCEIGCHLSSQSNQGSFISCSYKVKKQVATFTNCNVINFLGCEFAGNNHDGTIPFSFYQSSGINFKGNYIESFRENTPLAIIGTLNSVVNKAISWVGNYISLRSEVELFTVYGCDGLDISNNHIGTTISPLFRDVIGNMKGIRCEGNSGLLIESVLTNFIPNYNFCGWSNGTSSFPDGTSPVGSLTVGRRSEDGNFELVTQSTTQGFLINIDESNIEYLTFEIELKSLIDNIAYIDFYNGSKYIGIKSLSISSGEYKKSVFINYLNTEDLYYLRVRFSKPSVHHIKTVKAYRGIVEVNNDKNPLLLLSAPPLYGAFKKGHEVINNNPLPGNYEKWICIEGGSPGLWKGVSPIESFRSGIETFNGDGSTIKQIPHNLNKLPKTWYVQAASKDAGESEIKYIYCDNTNLNIVFKNPTKNGVNNIVLNWRADLL